MHRKSICQIAVPVMEKTVKEMVPGANQ